MNEKYFLDAIDDETLVKLVDKTLNVKKNAQNRSVKSSLLKIIPAAAMIALIIGLVNILPVFLNNVDIPVIDNPGVYTVDPGEEIELFVPVFVEKTFFEEKILANIPDGHDRNKLTAYYTINLPYHTSSEQIENGMIKTYSINRHFADRFYRFDPNASNREEDLILGYLRKYTNLTGNDIMQMYEDSGVMITEMPDPYAHVRFGATRDILLLDVEWHTAETYQAEVIDPFKENFAKLKELIEVSDEDEIQHQNTLQFFERRLNRIAERNEYTARTINGKPHSEGFTVGKNSYGILSLPLDSNGYYIYEVYPYLVQVVYTDENGVYRNKTFGTDSSNLFVYSLREYDDIMISQVIPFCDDLLERGLMAQWEYDNNTAITNPLEHYIDLWF